MAARNAAFFRGRTRPFYSITLSSEVPVPVSGGPSRPFLFQASWPIRRPERSDLPCGPSLRRARRRSGTPPSPRRASRAATAMSAQPKTLILPTHLPGNRGGVVPNGRAPGRQCRECPAPAKQRHVHGPAPASAVAGHRYPEPRHSAVNPSSAIIFRAESGLHQRAKARFEPVVRIAVRLRVCGPALVHLWSRQCPPKPRFPVFFSFRPQDVRSF